MNNGVTLKAMVSYEKQTKNNALELFSKENKSATDLVWMAYMVKYSQDNTTTFEQIENMTTEEFQAVMKSMETDAVASAKAWEESPQNKQ